MTASTTTSSEQANPAAELDKAREISAALTRCRAAARKNKSTETVCAPLERALAQVVAG
jgi:hypothetical protein